MWHPIPRPKSLAGMTGSVCVCVTLCVCVCSYREPVCYLKLTLTLSSILHHSVCFPKKKKNTLSLSLLQYANIFTHPCWQKEKKNLFNLFLFLPLHWIILGWRRSIKRHIFIICHHIHFYANEKPVPDENLLSVPQIEVSGNHVLFVFKVCL